MTHITVGDISPRIQYLADGTQTVFTYPFPIFKPADMTVYLGDALQDTGFAVAGAGQSGGGTVTFATAPAKDSVVTLRRRLAIARTTDFQQSGVFRSRVLNDELDYQTAALQQVNEQMSRTLSRAPTSTATTPLTLPEPEADKMLGWNGDATELENKAPGITGATAKTLGEGVPATASYDDATGLIAFGLPIGPQGRTGPAGADGRNGTNGTNGVFSEIASETEAKAGTDTAKGMTPERTRQAIGALSPPGVPVGTIIASACINAPAGYLRCNGAALSRTTYATLFSQIGTRFGAGNNSTTFNVPDLRGEFLRGWDNGRGVDSGRAFASRQGQDWKSFLMTNTLRAVGLNGGYSHGPVWMGKSTTSYTGNLFTGHWSTAATAIGLKWNTEEVRPRNVAVIFYIKY